MRISAYQGYATSTQIFASGRVLANRSWAGLTDTENVWRNLLNSFRQFNTNEVPNVAVRVRFEGVEQVVHTDKEGYYHAELPHFATSETTWFQAEASCEVQGQKLIASHDILAPGADAEFGVISDLDDTVIETNMTRLLTAAKLTFARNAKTRKPLEGVSALYASLARGMVGRPVNPIFYVSSSPWNLYDLLCEFMALNDIPKGPTFLLDWGIDRTKFIKPRGHRAKLERALQIMAEFPHLPFLLIGDSGQQDAGLYAEAATLYPDRIKAIYIRDVDPSTATRRDDEVNAHIQTATRHGVAMLLAPDSQAMAHHASGIGLIPARKEHDVQVEVAKDQARPSVGTKAATEAVENILHPPQS
ncbi:MAG TPA: phosphatase domain-containing protein [Chthoniobacterales bacterium]|jgi:phosphatidate phosphatase APP1